MFRKHWVHVNRDWIFFWPRQNNSLTAFRSRRELMVRFTLDTVSAGKSHVRGTVGETCCTCPEYCGGKKSKPHDLKWMFEKEKFNCSDFDLLLLIVICTFKCDFAKFDLISTHGC